MLRRQFIRGAFVTVAAGSIQGAESEWGGPVLDIHFHPRSGATREIGHLEGSGIRKAVLLPGAGSGDRAIAVMKEYPDRFVSFTNADV
jgi:hypothetical protein